MRNSAAPASSLTADFFGCAAACSSVIEVGQIPPANTAPSTTRYRIFTTFPVLKAKERYATRLSTIILTQIILPDTITNAPPTVYDKSGCNLREP